MVIIGENTSSIISKSLRFFEIKEIISPIYAICTISLDHNLKCSIFIPGSDALACLPTISTSQLTFMPQFDDPLAISTSQLTLMLQFDANASVGTML